jgi:hypothetical protein
VPAAVRLPRSVAVQRALLTLFILGGFLALAFVFGGSAQAASGTDHVGKGVSKASSGLIDPQKSPGSHSAGRADEKQQDSHKAELAEQRRAAERAAARTASGVMEPVRHSAEGAGQVVGPVGDTVDGVTDEVGARELSEQLGLGFGDRDEDAPGNGGGPSQDHGKDDSPAGSAGDAAYGPDGLRLYAGADSARALPVPGAAAANTGADDGTSRGSGGLPQQFPFHQVPSAPASSTSQYAGDGNGPRGGGQQQLAGCLTGVEHFGLLQPGAVRAAAGTATRDRAAEILEFPG